VQVIQIAFVMLAATLLPTAAFSQAKPAPDDAYLYFVWPQDGTATSRKSWASCCSRKPKLGEVACPLAFIRFARASPRKALAT
jgi:hypothetical protein